MSSDCVILKSAPPWWNDLCEFLSTHFVCRLLLPSFLPCSLPVPPSRVLTRVLADAVTASLTPVVVLAATLFWTRAGEGLATAQIFVILAVVAIVSEPLGVVLVAIPFFSNAFASLSRIQNFLQLEEIADTRIKTQSHEWRYSRSSSVRNRTLPGLSMGGGENEPPGLIRMADVTVVSNYAGTLLTDVSLELPMGSITMVYGPVGCGKSTLLRTILGESRIEAGSVTVPDAPMAFCDQTPWLQNGSIRDCIISQTEWVRTRYNKVLHACALDEDLVLLAEGDNTMVGTGGSNLSGGQKQRVVCYTAAPAFPTAPTKMLILRD